MALGASAGRDIPKAARAQLDLAALRIAHTITAHGLDVAQLREGRRLERVGLSEHTMCTRRRAGEAVNELAQFGHEI